MVLLVSLVFPFVKLGLLFITSFSLLSRQVSRPIVFFFRMYKRLSEWGMVEVYMLGILVSVIKMHQLQELTMIPVSSVFRPLSSSLSGLLPWSMKNYSGICLTMDAEDSPVKMTGDIKGSEYFAAEGKTAREAGLVRCLDCGKLSAVVAVHDDEVQRCPRCRAILHLRKTRSISKTWALVLTAGFFYLPANMFPMMRVDFMGSPDGSTILDGIIYFFNSGEFLIGCNNPDCKCAGAAF